MRRVCSTFIFISGVFSGAAQDSLKTLDAVRVTVPPKIDGMLDEAAWKDVPFANGFIQWDPSYKKPASEKTEVKVIYDNNAVYIGAFMYDSRPDSIFHELGGRDDADLNSDYFFAIIDTYNKLIDGYVFGVAASGVQIDQRLQDETYNAVWASAVRLNERGWCAEFRIPYSAIRFPDSKIQTWKIEFHRSIRRKRELDRWPFFPKDAPKFIKYFAALNGISDIKPPLRLSLTPYAVAYAENSPEYNADGTYRLSNSFSYSAGADIKYGIDERFTLDMILFPDFGQVQSDNKVKNLSYREVRYDENRPFFKEGTELFSKSNLFYSRRIGRTPSLYYSVPLMLSRGETIASNPSQARLLNAAKISGRNNNGLGLGLFNAITDDTYAVIRDSLGNRRNILTEPLTNYNIVVFDQQLKNSSSVYFINTNATRAHDKGNANVSGAGFELLNKKNTIKLSGDGALSQKFTRIDTLVQTYKDQVGYKYYTGIEKVGGNYTFGIKHEVLNNTYDQRDMGYNTLNNFRNHVAFFNYNQYAMGKFFRFSFAGLEARYAENFVTHRRTAMEFNFNSFAMLKKYLGIFAGSGLSPYKNYDYYEPRVPGKFYINRRYFYVYAGISTDYRKRFAVDLKSNFAQYINEGIDGVYLGNDLGLRFRINDRLSVFYNINYSFDEYNEGFANFDSLGRPVIGGRELAMLENKLRARYIFNSDMNISLNTRHYWNTGRYVKYFTLLDDGTIAPNTSYKSNNDFSYNAFTVDLVYTWIFLPGSSLNIVYKNVIETNDYITAIPRFSDNFSKTMQAPQRNSISLKLLYYLDYQSLKKMKKKKGRGG